MIHKFTAENFYSIGEKIEVNFETSQKKAETKNLYFQSVFDNKAVSKIMFIGGANASGKTNVLRVLGFLRYLIVESINTDKKDSMNYVGFIPYVNKRPTKLSVTFSIDDALYFYDIELNIYMILKEKLSRKKIITQRATKSTLFNRIWRGDTYEIRIGKELSNLKTMKNINQLANDNRCSSFISTFTNYDDANGDLRKVFDYWYSVLTNVQMVGTREINESMISLSEKAMKRVHENKDLYQSVIEILRKYDLGLNAFEKRKLGPEHEHVYMGVKHVYNDIRFEASMGFESSGTQRLIILLEIALLALSNVKGGAAVLDELDAFLHPDMYEEILELFMSKKTNPYGVQLIFSAQNYSIMSKLDKQQIILTEKNMQGETEVWRLDNVKGVRSDQNYFVKYLSGAYGAVPRIG